MGLSCVGEMPGLTEYLDQAQEWFPNKHRVELANLLGLYFEYKGLVPSVGEYAETYRTEDTPLEPLLKDNLPSKPQFRAFMGIAKKLSRKKENLSLDAQALLHKRENLVHSFTTSQRLDNTAMIGRDFEEYITKHKPSDMTRKDYINSIGGVAGVLNQVLDSYKRKSFASWWQKQYEKTNKVKLDSANEEHQRLLDNFEMKAKEFKKIADNFDALAMDALTDIQKLEEIEIDYFGVSLQEAIERQQDDIEDENDENIVKGENFNIDYRTISNQDTLAIVADRVLRSVPLLDENGKQVSNYIGYKRFVNPLRIHGYLSELMGNATSSEHMMELLLEESEVTPWVRGLYDVLAKDDTAQTAVFVNYKKAVTRYEDIYRKTSWDKGSTLQVAQQNSMKKTNAALKNLASTMLSGVVLQKDTSIYDENGKLVRDPERLERIEELFKTLKEYGKDAVSGTNRPVPKLLVRRQEWIKKHPDAIELMTKAVRSLGFEITRKNIERLVWGTNYSKEDLKRFKRYGGEYMLLKLLKTAYGDFVDSLEKGHSPEDFVSTSGVLRDISKVLGVVSYDDVESRALIDGKSYVTHTTPNLIHQVADELVGRGQEKGALDNGFEAYIWDKFGKYEGFHLTRSRAEIELEIQRRLDTTDKDLIEVPPGFESNPRALMEARQIAHDKLLAEYEDSISRGSRPIGWIAKLSEDSADSGMFQVIDVPDFQDKFKKDPSKWNIIDRFKVDWAFFNQGYGRQAYATPIQSDYNVYNVITGPVYETDIITTGGIGEQVYNTNSEIVQLFVDEVKAEMQRIDRIHRTLSQDENGVPDPTKRVVMTTYEREGSRFHIFPKMNEDGVKEKYDSLKAEVGGGIEAEMYLAQTIAKYLNDYVQDKLEKYNKAGLFEDPDFSSFVKDNVVVDKKGKLRHFLLNEFYAQIQIAKIFFGGEHFFSNIDEYHKRGMFAHSPRTAIDTTAKWDDKLVSDRKTYTTAIIEDQEEDSLYIDRILSVYDDAIAAGLITEKQKEQYKQNWYGITSTDGQAFRSLPSFREVCIRMDKNMWTEKHESAYQALLSGNISPEILETLQSITLAQNLKTVVTGFSDVDTGLLDENGENIIVRQPFIYKHSEAVMFAPYIAQALRKKMPQYSSPILQAIGNFMVNNKVDVVEFHSCVKMGDTGVISSKSIKSSNGKTLDAKTIEEELSTQFTTIKGAKHETPYKYYGIASSTPVDYADVKRAFSSQALKMTFNDIQDTDEVIRPDGKTVKAKEIKEQFYRIYAQDIQDAWDTLKEQFSDDREIEQLLQQELASKSYNSKDLKVALSLIQNNQGKLEFAIPLISPATTRTVQALLTSVIRNRLGKEKTKGGNLIQQTSLGFDNYAGADVAYSDETPEGWGPLEIKFKEGTNTLDCVEVYMPIHDKRLLQYADETGAISPARLKELTDAGIIDKRILEFVAYRTPTDGIHATIPCRIKGFLPRAAGGNIIMPREVMVLTGNDFDVDKMLCHFKEFRTSLWNEDKLWEAYNKIRQGDITEEDAVDAFMTMFMLSKKQRELLEKDRLPYKQFRNALKENPDSVVASKYRYDQPHVSLIEYDYNADPENQSMEARHNAEVELIYSNITSKIGTMRFMIPGGFEGIKQRAYTTWLLNSNKPEVKDMLDRMQKKYGLSTRAELRDYILKQPSKRLKGVVTSAMAGNSAYDIFERHTAHKEIMDGRALIPRYALYNSGLAMLQGSGISITPLKKAVYKDKKKVLDKDGNPIYTNVVLGICGYKLASLDDMFNQEGALKSTTLAQLISAAVDNRNNPILSFLNQNDATVDLTLALIAAGIPEDLVFTVISQPIVRQYAQLKMENPYDSAASIFDAIIEKEKSRYNTPDRIMYAKEYPQGYESATKYLNTRSEADLVENLGKSLSSYDTEFVKDQLAIAYVLKGLSYAADDLNTLIMCLRPENKANACGPYIGSTISNIQRIEDFQSKVQKGECGITFSQPIVTTFNPGTVEGTAIDEAYKQNQHLPMTALMNSLMLYGSSQLLSPYLVTATANWQDVTKAVARMYNVNKVKDAVYLSIQNEMILWKLMKDPDIVTDDMKANRHDLVVNLPKRLIALKKHLTEVRKLLADPETAKLVNETDKGLVENRLLQKIWATYAKENKIQRIQLRLGGILTEKITQQLRDAWDELLFTKDPIEVEVDGQTESIDLRQFAIDLFKYNLYTDGFGFGQYTISQMAPPSVQMYCPGWIKALRKLSDPNYGEFTESELELFKIQYCQNHWYNHRLVPRIEDEDWQKAISIENDETIVLKKFSIQADREKGIKPKVFDPTVYANKELWGSGFITHKDSKGNVTLYRITEHSDDSITLVEYPKTGNYDSYRQVGLQYEPYSDPRSIIPIQTGLNAADENFSWDADRIGGLRQNDINAENPRDNEDKTPVSDKKLRTLRRMEDIGLNPFNQRGIRVDSSSVNEAMSIDTNTVVEEKPDTPENTEELTQSAVEHNDRESLPGIKLFNLVRHTTNDKGKAVVQTIATPATAASVRAARNQKIDYELNKAIRAILAKAGIGVGVLYDFEAELGAAGVTDFSMARTVAEGLVELVRIANGEEGEAALPEEFSHLAMAMLGPGNPLVERLMNSMTEGVIKEVLGEFYDDYYEQYGGNQHQLAFEAAGKLVAKHLLYGEPIPEKPYKNILQRLIDAIKRVLRKIGIRDLQYEIAKAEEASDAIAKGLLEGNLADLMAMDNIEETTKYLEIVKELEKNGTVLDNVLQRDYKRLHLLEQRTKNKDEDTKSKILDPAKILTGKMQEAIVGDKQDACVNDYLLHTIEFLRKCDNGLTAALNSAVDANTLCRKLRLDRDIIYSFQANLVDLRKYARQNPNAFSQTTMISLSKAQSLLTEFSERYHEAAMEQFVGWIKSVMGDQMVVGIGKNKGKVIKAESLALSADSDINFINRWLDSMADQPDMLNKIFDEAVRQYKEKVRRFDIDMRVRIDKAFADLYRATGSRDQGFMFSRKDGKKTGRYLSEKEAKEKLSAPQYAYYKEMIAIKKELDLMLPVKEKSLYRTIKIRKDLLDRLKSADSFEEGWKSLHTAVQDKFLVRGDDEEYLAASSIVDFEGTKVDTVPLYYLKIGKGESEEDMSEDVASTMLAYAHMADNYKELNGIIDILENARSMAQEREITMRRGKKQEQQVVQVNGRLISTIHTKAQKETRVGAMLDDFFQMQVYNHMRNDAGTIGNTSISVQKSADVINELTSLSTMALNFNQRIANVTVGSVQIVEEAVAGQFFKAGTWAKANAFYLEHLPEMMGQAGAQTNTSFLAMLDEMFDITQENAGRFRDRKYRKNAFEKNANTSLLTLGLTAGEHWMSMSTGISVLLEYKVKEKGPNGKVVPLIKALAVQFADSTNKVGGKMGLKEGYTKEDGTEFTDKDIYKLTKKIGGINHKLQGIYNTNDKNMIVQHWYGVLIMMFRKWMVPNLRRRYGGANYDFMTDTWVEGFYRSLFQFVAANAKDWMQDITHFRTVVTTNWDKLTPEEKANIRRALAEVGVAVGILSSIMLLGRIHMEDDDDGKSFSDWLYNMTYYQLLRMKTEVFAQMPGPSMVTEGKKLLAEPFAGLRVLENTVQLFELLNPLNTEKTFNTKIQSGRYKGHTYAYKYLMQAPVISMGNQIYRAFDQSDLIAYYKHGGF